MNACKTHCPHGHEYTAENTLITIGRNGRPHRECRVCKRARSNGWAATEEGKAWRRERYRTHGREGRRG